MGDSKIENWVVSNVPVNNQRLLVDDGDYTHCEGSLL